MQSFVPPKEPICLSYLRFAYNFWLLRRQMAFVLGLVITDQCQLSCLDCRVANTGQPSLSLDKIRNMLDEGYRRGYRELYLEGGEPFLWKDGRWCLDDVIRYARRCGYHHVHIYTNGLSRLETQADLVWVSVDGLIKDYTRLRGRHFNQVMTNIRKADRSKLGIVYTVNTVNQDGIEKFLKYVARERLARLGVIFYFHTPYYGKDWLFLTATERSQIIDRLIYYKKIGLPVFNSYGGLRDLKSGKWPRPNSIWAVADRNGFHPCCRFCSPETCNDCGFSACTEITAAQKFSLSAIQSLARLW
jgi:Fe-coproporphyrin III synthase